MSWRGVHCMPPSSSPRGHQAVFVLLSRTQHVAPPRRLTIRVPAWPRLQLAGVPKPSCPHRQRLPFAEDAGLDDLTDQDHGIASWCLRDEAADDVAECAGKCWVAGVGLDHLQVQGGELVSGAALRAPEVAGEFGLAGGERRD